MFISLFTRLGAHTCRRFASFAHLSPLADAFNTSFISLPEQATNAVVTGLFGNDHLVSPSGFDTLLTSATEDCSRLLREAVSHGRGRSMVQVLDDMSDTICRVADLADCVRMLHPDSEFRSAASVACQAMGRLVEELNTNPNLYAAAVQATTTDSTMDQIDRRVLELFIADFELSGVQLRDPVRQAEFVRAASAALTLGSEFVEASLTPVPFNPVHLGTHNTDIVELSCPLTDDPRPDRREASYRAFYAPLAGQEERLRELMAMRHRMARAAGFDNFADRVTRHSLAGTSERVGTFLQHICRPIVPLATRIARDQLLPIVATLNARATADGTTCVPTDGRMWPWDVGYSLGLNRQAIRVEELMDYFSLGACMEGVAQLAACLFGLRLRVEPTAPGESWHENVVKVNVHSMVAGMSGPVGVVYCDLFDRPFKPAQDCHYTIQGGRRLSNGNYQHPIIVLQLTLTPPTTPASPPLLTPGQVENLFHEWGHALHSLLARTRYQHVTGTRCSTDLAEIPSTLFERFALDPRVTKEYARHWRAGVAPGTRELNALYRMAIGGGLGCSVEIMQQASYAQLDQVLHSKSTEYTLPEHRHPYPSSTVLLSNIQSEAGLANWLACDPQHLLAWPHRFTHLVGYGGRYYAYLMAKAGSQLIWNHCFAQDPWSSSDGQRYVDHVLRHGGEFPPSHMLANLLNDDAVHPCTAETALSPEALASGLVAQVDENESAALSLLERVRSPSLRQPHIVH